MAITEKQGKQYHNIADLLTYIAEKQSITNNIKDAYQYDPAFTGTPPAITFHDLTKAIIPIIADNYIAVAPTSSTTGLYLNMLPIKQAVPLPIECYQEFILTTGLTSVSGTVTDSGANPNVTTIPIAGESGKFYVLLVSTKVASTLACGAGLAVVNNTEVTATLGLPAGVSMLLLYCSNSATINVTLTTANATASGTATATTKAYTVTAKAVSQLQLVFPS